ncbi:hypothetical protein [Nocardiopsis dassonvillei]|uniref:hypothetical protein n=1 Tax=Nocardiopsis dassonvillei TaxID=2014 RepID=UPI003F5444CC
MVDAGEVVQQGRAGAGAHPRVTAAAEAVQDAVGAPVPGPLEQVLPDPRRSPARRRSVARSIIARGTA